MRHVKSFEMLQETKNEKREIEEQQLVLVVKNELSGVIGKLHKFRTGSDDDFYRKGDLLMYMGQYKGTNWETYLNFAITRGHGLGRYEESRFIRYEKNDFWKKVDKKIFKLIDNITERDKLLQNA